MRLLFLVYLSMVVAIACGWVVSSANAQIEIGDEQPTLTPTYTVTPTPTKTPFTSVTYYEMMDGQKVDLIRAAWGSKWSVLFGEPEEDGSYEQLTVLESSHFMASLVWQYEYDDSESSITYLKTWFNPDYSAFPESIERVAGIPMASYVEAQHIPLFDDQSQPLAFESPEYSWGLFKVYDESLGGDRAIYVASWMFDSYSPTAVGFSSFLSLIAVGPPVSEFNQHADELQGLLDGIRVVDPNWAGPADQKVSQEEPATEEASNVPEGAESYQNTEVGWSVSWDPTEFSQQQIMSAELMLQHQQLPVSAVFMTITPDNPMVSSGLLSLTDVWTCEDAVRQYNSAQIMQDGQTLYPGAVVSTENRFGLLLMDTEGRFSVVECHVVVPGESMVWIQISIGNTMGEPFSSYEAIVQEILERVTVS